MWKTNSVYILLLTATVIATNSLVPLGESQLLQGKDYQQQREPHPPPLNDQFVFGESAAKVNCSGRNRIVYKESKLFIEIPPTLSSRSHQGAIEKRRWWSTDDDAATAPCSILFRSPFQCPHPYAVQVIEDNPQKCHQNLHNCFLHQRVYRTRDGVLEVNLVNKKTFASDLPNSRLLLHVERLDCEVKKGNGSREGYSALPSSDEPFTGRLRVIVNGDSGLVNTAEEEEESPTTTVSDQESGFPSNKVNHGNHQIYPPPVPHYLPQPPPNPVENYLITQQPRTTSVFLISPGFPRNPSGNGDCSFIIPRVDLHSCRLRINFKFFNLPDPDERTCHYHYLLIDNRRICGCRSGLIYLSQWDFQPKTIRYVNKRLRPSQENVGFLLEVVQEQCPNRYEFKAGVLKEQQQQLREVEPVTSEFYQNSRTGRFFHNQHCRFHFHEWLAVLGSPLWASRQQCRAMVPFPGAQPQYYW